MKATTSEIGRELKASELEPRTVIVMEKEGCPHYATVWVSAIRDDLIAFYMGGGMGGGSIHLIARRQGDSLFDDEARLHVYQYLGGDEPTSGAARA